jgi:hypothetical protein
MKKYIPSTSSSSTASSTCLARSRSILRRRGRGIDRARVVTVVGSRGNRSGVQRTDILIVVVVVVIVIVIEINVIVRQREHGLGMQGSRRWVVCYTSRFRVVSYSGTCRRRSCRGGPSRRGESCDLRGCRRRILRVRESTSNASKGRAARGRGSPTRRAHHHGHY